MSRTVHGREGLAPIRPEKFAAARQATEYAGSSREHTVSVR
jgi:hypothetical protein